MPIKLRGLTWDHPRGYAPLTGGAKEYEARNPGTAIAWDRRSLRDFGEAPVEQYLDRYDLLIVDHPFVGFAAAHDVLIDLAPSLGEAERQVFARDSVGPSWESYWYSGGLWALPVDAATQVASYRPDLLKKLSSVVPETIDDVLALGQQARTRGKFIIVPACPTDAISMFISLCASLGHPVDENAEVFAEPAVGQEVLEHLHALLSLAHPNSVEFNPIQAYDFMASSEDAIYCPFGFGYTNYSRRGVAVPLKFTDAPSVRRGQPARTMLGGAGVAVSSKSPHPGQAVAYAKWLASPEHQRGTYFHQGGQPASRSAWNDPSNDTLAGNFFSGTLRTLQNSYLRPRFDGFVPFFEQAGIQINQCLRKQVSDKSLLASIHELYGHAEKRSKGRISPTLHSKIES